MTPYLIAIAGPSGSGKSLFAELLLEQVKAQLPNLEVSAITEDAYYRDQASVPVKERDKVNYDHPDALEHDLLAEHLTCLRNGEAVKVPVYDYAVHTRSSQVVDVKPTPVIVVEGILLLSNEELRDCFDVCFYLDAPLDVCLVRRLERDTRERGRSLESVLEQYCIIETHRRCWGYFRLVLFILHLPFQRREQLYGIGKFVAVLS